MSSNAVVGSSKSAAPTSTAATASPPHSSSIDDADHHNHSHSHVTTTTTITSPTSQTPAKLKTISSESSRRAKELFGDCALVEIIHLHDCFRGALRTLENDVSELCRAIDGHVAPCLGKWNDLERRIAGRFTVIWSVFRAHSAAEDEFIWPALKAKQVALPEGGECDSHCGGSRGSEEGIAAGGGGAGGVVGIRDVVIDDGGQPLQPRERLNSTTVHCIEQEEYEEDHADEERMFLAINDLMSKLREELVMFQRNEAEGNSHSRNNRGVDETGGETADDAVHPNKSSHVSSLQRVAKLLLDGTRNLMRHLMVHLDKEETHCMPLVAQYLTKSEIHDLIGKIMGKRSSELMSQILTMAVQNLDDSDRDDMVGYMKQAMVGTFFERWLKMGGWINSQHGSAAGDDDVAAGDAKEEEEEDGRKPPFQRDQNEIAAEVTSVEKDATNDDIGVTAGDDKMERDCCCNRADDTKRAANSAAATTSSTAAATASDSIASAQAQGAPTHNANQNNHNHNNNNNLEEPTNGNYTSAAELEKLIRAIGTNPNLDTKQKNLTIQGLRDSVWKSNCRLSKRKREEWEDETSTAAMEHTGTQASHFSGDEGNPDRSMVPTGGMVSQPTHHLSFAGARTSASVGTRFKRETPPSSYYKKNKEGDVQLAWKHDPHSTSSNAMEASVPLFSAAELAPTYHDGGINRVLGCPHYARSCKLRHPTSGRLYTCRLCCEQDREMATKDKDSPLDRYEVKEILCMICGALQPAGKHCVNPECASEGKPFARYSCGICNFYDNSPDKAIYHCPFCNVCRSGRGLGIDYRHCMRCNACVSLTDDHHCIPQRLQANCPICHETMFQSTEPLRGLQCGHVMHLNCFTMYMRGGNYTCPLCKKSAEDMTEYFALLDSAIRMQPMPPAYAATTSNIYCQDCGKMGNVSYHFVGLKCQHCGSFNTRELQRVDPNIMASLWQGY